MTKESIKYISKAILILVVMEVVAILIFSAIYVVVEIILAITTIKGGVGHFLESSAAGVLFVFIAWFFVAFIFTPTDKFFDA